METKPPARPIDEYFDIVDTSRKARRDFAEDIEKTSVPSSLLAEDQQFAEAYLAEVQRSRQLFPGTDVISHALGEEVGEIHKALMYEPWHNVVRECLQVAAMAHRLALEGDHTMGYFRMAQGLTTPGFVAENANLDAVVAYIVHNVIEIGGGDLKRCRAFVAQVLSKVAFERIGTSNLPPSPTNHSGEA